MEREIERIPVWIRSIKHPEWVRVRLWDYSISGFGLIYNSNSGASDFSNPGDSVDLKCCENDSLDLNTAKSHVIQCRIENTVRVDKGMRIGLSRLDLPGPGNGDGPDLPSDHLHDTIRPLTAKIQNPFLYKEWSEAELIGIGPKANFVFESSDSSLLLFVEAAITIDIEVPLDTRGICSGTIAWIRTGLNGRVVFAIRDTDVSFDLSNAIGEHFVRAEICKPSRLTEFGISLKRFKDQFRFRFITTQEEYEFILKLRQSAYVHSGKAPLDSPLSQHGNEFDAGSRLLAAFHGDNLAASVALNFGASEETPFRSQTEFPDGKYPVAIPPKDSVIEIQSLCTDFDYRGGDLIQAMFEQIGRCVLFSDREWLLTFTSEKLWPLYRRTGFRKTGASARIKALGGLEHHLILAHRDSITTGLGMSPFAWNYFFGQLTRDLLANGHIRLGFAGKCRVACYSWFAGFTRTWMHSQLEREFKDLLQKSVVKDGTDDR